MKAILVMSAGILISLSLLNSCGLKSQDVLPSKGEIDDILDSYPGGFYFK